MRAVFIITIHIGESDVTESTFTIRSLFLGGITLCVKLGLRAKIYRVIEIKLNQLV